MNVEKFSDDLWLGIKGQSNLEIAGSPRNSFRASLRRFPAGVELRFRLRGCITYLAQTNSEYRVVYPGSQTARDKLRGREGNSPDWQLRPRIHAKCRQGGGVAQTARMLA